MGKTNKKKELSSDEAFRKWKEEFIQHLQSQAQESYKNGGILGYKYLGMEPDMMVINSAALDYADRYGEQLRADGSTTIGGKKIKWADKLAQGQRDDVQRIIKQGIKDGLPTGKTQAKNGKYSKGTIAEQLKTQFNKWKSHASTVARTEVGRITNIASIERWKGLGYKKVKVLDNEGPNSCQACREANGQIWDIDYAMSHELEHPNCVRAFNPIKPE